MLFELEQENLYKQAYFEALKYRLAYGSLELEGIDDDLADARQTIKIFNQLSAINHIFDGDYTKLSHLDFTNLVCEIASLVSGGEISNFRNTKAIVNGSKVERSNPQMIRNDLWYLIDDYNYMISNAKDSDSLMEAEAIFHIRFLHIHPFEDANGRTARILLAYNMAKNNIAPAIITKATKKEYCDCIEHNDYKRLKKLFEELSHKELDTMISLYNDLDSKGEIESNKMTEEQEKTYRKIILGNS